ncbi:hypothetical protein DFQ29_003349 [Apophysomyces sp. BC1021]|nr:hypothetical protein DFQ29_003349 [Apophysomyces sp. BC1021]
MFVLPKNPQAELWDGPRTGIEGVKEIFGADEAYNNARFPQYLKNALTTAEHVFLDSPILTPSLLSDEKNKRLIDTGKATMPRSWVKRVFGFCRGASNKNGRRLSLIEGGGNSVLVQELRAIKSPHEIELMKTSGHISSKAFIEAMKWTKPGFSEAQLWAKLDYECRMRGSNILAYVPVVAGGPNALSLHYVRNDMTMRQGCEEDGDLVLVDCGGEYNGYASDITRTWPVNGKFTKPQADLYQVVLNTNKACIKMCTEKANRSLHDIHEESVKIMMKELHRIGFKVESWDLQRILYPHHVGHYLGLDVHDLADITRSRKLKKNMVVTIEPGLYIPYDDRFPREYQGIGIRIEDNVVVGETDPYNLTATAPKEIVDIEFCCATNN